MAAGALATSTTRARGRDAWSPSPPPPRQRRSRGTRPAAASRSAREAARAPMPCAPPPGALIPRARVAELAFHLRQLRVELLQLGRAAQQHVVAEVIADRHLIGEAAEIPMQFGDLRRPALPTAALRARACSSRLISAGFDDVRQVLRLLLEAFAVAFLRRFFRTDGGAGLLGTEPTPGARAFVLGLAVDDSRAACGCGGCRFRSSGRRGRRGAGSTCRPHPAQADHLRRGRAGRARATRAADQHPHTHRQQQHPDARDQRQHVAALPQIDEAVARRAPCRSAASAGSAARPAPRRGRPQPLEQHAAQIRARRRRTPGSSAGRAPAARHSGRTAPCYRRAPPRPAAELRRPSQPRSPAGLRQPAPSRPSAGSRRASPSRLIVHPDAAQLVTIL